jgi:hypothetical protein
MATTLGFKDILDLPMWRPEAPALAASAAGSSLSWDMRNGETNTPYIYLLRSATAFDFYDPTTGEWGALASPALAGTFGAGATSIMHPSQGPRGTIAAGATTTTFTLTTALPAAVGVNQLANRGDGIGYRIAVIGNSAGGSGLIEYRNIIANTAGTTPTITLDAALSFTPALGDGYEIRAGRVFLLSAGTLAAGVWKYYEIATNSFSGNLATTNLPATIGTDSSGIALSESHVPSNRNSGEGFVSGSSTYNASSSKNCILATATSATTITGSGMNAALRTNEYRNFQVRIVQDTVTPTAVGQRRNITSHTSGDTGVFTVPTWTVTPSSSARFVIENNDDRILLRSSASTSFFTYNITANTWDVSTFTAGGSASGAGVKMCQSFGIEYDTSGNARHSFIYIIRGAATSTIDVLDIAGGANGTISAGITYGHLGQTFTTGTCGAYDPITSKGRYLHLNINGTQRMARFDVRNRKLDAETYLRFPQGAAIVGDKMAMALFVDGATKVNTVYHLTNTQTQMFSLLVQS